MTIQKIVIVFLNRSSRYAGITTIFITNTTKYNRIRKAHIVSVYDSLGSRPLRKGLDITFTNTLGLGKIDETLKKNVYRKKRKKESKR